MNTIHLHRQWLVWRPWVRDGIAAICLLAFFAALLFWQVAS